MTGQYAQEIFDSFLAVMTRKLKAVSITSYSVDLHWANEIP